MNPVIIRKKAKDSRPQPYFGDWKKIYKPLSNYLKQIIHAKNTIGVLIPDIDYFYYGTVFYEKIFYFEEEHSEDVIESSYTKESETFLKGLNDKHKELNKLGIFCIISFHNFNPNERWSSVKTCSTWIHFGIIGNY